MPKKYDFLCRRLLFIKHYYFKVIIDKWNDFAEVSKNLQI